MNFKIILSPMKTSLSAWLRPVRLLVLGLALPAGAMAADEQSFASPTVAVNALVAAAANNDTNALHAIFGAEGQALVSPDAVQAEEGFKLFVEHLKEKTQLVTKSDSLVTLDIGTNGWPFPIPLVKQPDGQWCFDTAAGSQEILARRIGRDELGAIAVCRA